MFVLDDTFINLGVIKQHHINEASSMFTKTNTEKIFQTLRVGHGIRDRSKDNM